MRSFIDNTLQLMDDIIKNLGDAIMIILVCIWAFLVLLTLPIWAIPYLIWKKKGDTNERNTSIT